MTKPKAQMANYYLPDHYHQSVEATVGRLVLQYGQLDRLFAQQLERRANPKITIVEAIAIVRKGSGKTLGAWKTWFKKEAHKIGIYQSWADEVTQRIATLQPTRDRIVHDTLMLNSAGGYEWKTNQTDKVTERDHKPFEMEELTRALHQVSQFKQFLLLPQTEDQLSAIA